MTARPRRGAHRPRRAGRPRRRAPALGRRGLAAGGVPDAARPAAADRYALEEQVVDVRYLAVRDGAVVRRPARSSTGRRRPRRRRHRPRPPRPRARGRLVSEALALAAAAGCDVIGLDASTRRLAPPLVRRRGFAETPSWFAVDELDDCHKVAIHELLSRNRRRGRRLEAAGTSCSCAGRAHTRAGDAIAAAREAAADGGGRRHAAGPGRSGPRRAAASRGAPRGGTGARPRTSVEGCTFFNGQRARAVVGAAWHPATVRGPDDVQPLPRVHGLGRAVVLRAPSLDALMARPPRAVLAPRDGDRSSRPTSGVVAGQPALPGPHRHAAAGARSRADRRRGALGARPARRSGPCASRTPTVRYRSTPCAR